MPLKEIHNLIQGFKPIGSFDWQHVWRSVVLVENHPPSKVRQTSKGLHLVISRTPQSGAWVASTSTIPPKCLVQDWRHLCWVGSWRHLSWSLHVSTWHLSSWSARQMCLLHLAVLKSSGNHPQTMISVPGFVKETRRYDSMTLFVE